MMRPKPPFCFIVADCRSWLFLPVGFFFLG